MWLIITVLLTVLCVLLCLLGVAWPFFFFRKKHQRWYEPWWQYWLSVCRPLLGWRHRQRIQKLARDRSEEFAERLFAVQCGMAMMVILIGVLCTLLHVFTVIYALFWLVIAIFSFFYPLVRLRRLRQEQDEQIRKALPFSLDLLSLSLEGGMSFYTAFLLCVRLMPAGFLQKQFQYVIDDIRTGSRQEQAFQQLSLRIQLTELDAFISALLQNAELGGSLSTTLRQQAQRRRQERFLRAEKKALEAPVKMIFPLVFCIFPCTFIVIGYPLFIQLVQYL